MTTLYLDSEYNGHNGELISMALVSPKGHEFYECMEPIAPWKAWVFENVFPKLGKPQIGYDKFRFLFRDFLEQFDEAEIICDWPADLTYFCQLLCGNSYEESVYFPFSARMLVTPPGEPKPENPHNALSDARALMKWHQGLGETK